jgi:hypothetical protein
MNHVAKTEIYTPSRIVNMMLDMAGYSHNVTGKHVMGNSLK